MIDQIISDLKHTKRDIENEFKGWFKFATDMAAPVGVNPEKPRTAKCWSRTSTDCESYYRLSIAVPVMDNIIDNLEDRMADRKHTEIFSLLLSVCLLEHFNLGTSTEELIKHFQEDLQCKILTTFRSKLKRWVKQWRIETENRKAEYSATAPKAKKVRVNGKKSYNIVEPPNNFLEAL